MLILVRIFAGGSAVAEPGPSELGSLGGSIADIEGVDGVAESTKHFHWGTSCDCNRLDNVPISRFDKYIIT